MRMTIVNLEQGMPTVEQARIKLDQALRSAKSSRTPCVKIIHGYGSSGKGGAIKREVQQILSGKKRSGYLKNFVPGERFSPFDPAARDILAHCPSLSRDSDYSKGNDGVTIVLL